MGKEREAEGGSAEGERWQVYLNIRLCHTRGSADNFITSTYKNDCRVMQMAFASHTRLRSACRPRAEETRRWSPEAEELLSHLIGYLFKA